MLGMGHVTAAAGHTESHAHFEEAMPLTVEATPLVSLDANTRVHRPVEKSSG